MLCKNGFPINLLCKCLFSLIILQYNFIVSVQCENTKPEFSQIESGAVPMNTRDPERKGNSS